ncbi:Zinc finger ZZ-type [Penicillium hispanicum]|uniref:Zinc finger ZZ-type n=1 Tax=Penicillium hispanicum TaxID=1080232 RepID=UPI002540E779|nr:Zinc finger ZZ-type [Penicillium hispanicum]KAJ5594511.1 Zinc finger ZZ-type [Penicillium hispanicum]
MATPALPSHPGPDHLVTVKVLYNDSNRRFKLPLGDLRAQVLPQKLVTLLGVPTDVNVILERYSDSAGSYIRLDCDNTAVYKQLYRAAKAKSKLRIKVSVVDPSPSAPAPAPAEADTLNPAQPVDQNPPRHSYLETVLSSPIPAAHPEPVPVTADASPASLVDAPNNSLGLPASQPKYRDFEMEQSNPRFPVISHTSPNGMFCIDCNNCGSSIANEHYHCSICEYGDYDLCPQCVDDGASCRGEGHWLIKRVVLDGIVTNSTTETIPPRRLQVQESKSAVPVVMPPVSMGMSAPKPVPEMAAPVPDDAARSDVAAQGEDKPMCNGCCREADETNLVRCNDCEDYDLCLRCLLRNKHGHHPAHTFHLGSDRNFCLKNLIMSRCLPGRQFKHAAVCDGCEKRIVGTRHKCLTCPDWDYCSDCIKDASQSHFGHRFAPIYEAIGDQPREFEIHYGIFCDGPLCKDKSPQSYISGVRYKCAVCDDVDLCANCEAHPRNLHNRTHPMVKFKTPVRTVSVSTITDDGSTGSVTLGDHACPHDEPRISTPVNVEKEQPVVKQVPVEVDANEPEDVPQPTNPEPMPTTSDDASITHRAYFVRDAIADGTKLPPNTVFRQTWTLYNPGPHAWPVGSDVRFVGGDTMFNVDASHPSSVESIRSAMESNKLTSPVEPGQSADFTVTLRTPRREGTVISYWRLKLPNGVPIGHRLWCDVQVQTVASPTIATAKPTNVAESVASEASAPANPEPTGSRMIFPKLEKESPDASTHEVSVPAHQAPTVSAASEGDLVEDVESLTLDEVDTDAGFLTDEEYDVLDASDQEFLDAKQSVH